MKSKEFIILCILAVLLALALIIYNAFFMPSMFDMPVVSYAAAR